METQKKIVLLAIVGVTIATLFNGCGNPLAANRTSSRASRAGTNESYTPPSNLPLQKPEAFGESGMQRLTQRQLILTLEQNLGASLSTVANVIPLDSSSSTHFENDYTSLSVTEQIVLGYSTFAESVAKLYSTTRFQQDIGCSPTSAADTVCFKRFIARMGQRFFRRPLTTAEMDLYANTLLEYSQQENRFMTAVELALEAFVQHPEFLYRIEAGTNQAAPVGLVRLNSYEVASRLAFLITGRGPNDSILAAAAAGELESAAGRIALVDQLMGTANAKQNWNDFHGQWLGYGNLILDPNYKNDFILESDKLIEEVNFNKKSDMLDIFRYDKYYVTPKLAGLYGIAGVTQSRWVESTTKRGGGILSHGSFAALGKKFNDTSPTLRGYEIFKRVFCGKFDSDIPANVDVNLAPGSPNDCKTERYFMRNSQTCSTCHAVTDGLGFGLEAVDPLGRLRDHETNNSQCSIDGEGEYANVGFQGPRELGKLIANSPEVFACATEHIFEFMMGRKATDDDEATLDALEGEYYLTRNLIGIVKAIASSEAMVFMRGQ